MDNNENMDSNDNSSDSNTLNYNNEKHESFLEGGDYSKENNQNQVNECSSSNSLKAKDLSTFNNTKNSVEKEEEAMEYGNHKFPCYPAPPVSIKLFIGRVPKSYEEEQLRPIFEEFGVVNEVVIIRDKVTNAHKSSAFVKMASIAEADNAIRCLNNQKTLDQQLGSLQVKYASGEVAKLGFPQNIESGSDQAKLFIGSLPKNITEDSVKDLFSPYGTVEEVFIMKDNNTGMGKGCSFVKFAYKEQALYAINSLNGKKTMDGCSRAIEVRFAEPKSAKQQQTQMPMTLQPVHNSHHGVPPQHPVSSPNSMNYMNNFGLNNNYPRAVGPWKEYFSGDGRPYYYNEQTNVTQWDMPKEFDTLFVNNAPSAHTLLDTSGPAGANLFIFHVPNEWQQSDLIQAFAPFGELLSAKIATEKNTGRNRGFAFVSYDNIESAAAAIAQMNGFMALNKKLKVTVKKGEEEEMKKFINQNGLGSFQHMMHPQGMPHSQKNIPPQPNNAATSPNSTAHQNAQAQNCYYSNSNCYRCGPY